MLMIAAATAFPIPYFFFVVVVVIVVVVFIEVRREATLGPSDRWRWVSVCLAFQGDGRVLADDHFPARRLGHHARWNCWKIVLEYL